MTICHAHELERGLGDKWGRVKRHHSQYKAQNQPGTQEQHGLLPASEVISGDLLLALVWVGGQPHYFIEITLESSHSIQTHVLKMMF